MSLMRATPCALSVMIGICQPCQERAVMPIACSTMASSPAVTCSPVATMASYSRASCRGEASRTQATSWLVTPAMAETTTATLVAGVDLALDVTGDVANALDVGHRRAAELHHQERHDDPRVCPGVRVLAARDGAASPQETPTSA